MSSAIDDLRNELLLMQSVGDGLAAPAVDVVQLRLPELSPPPKLPRWQAASQPRLPRLPSTAAAAAALRRSKSDSLLPEAAAAPRRSRPSPLASAVGGRARARSPVGPSVESLRDVPGYSRVMEHMAQVRTGRIPRAARSTGADRGAARRPCGSCGAGAAEPQSSGSDLLGGDGGVDGAHQSRAARRWEAVRATFRDALSAEYRLRLLRGVPILGGASEYKLRQLLRAMQLRVVGRLRRLVRQYEPPRAFALILHGEAEARELDQPPRPLSPGDCFGLEALGVGAEGAILLPSIRSVTSMTPLLVLELPADVTEACRLRGERRKLKSADQMRLAVDTYWLERLLEAQRPLVQRQLISVLMLRLRQFAHLRSSLDLRLHLASLFDFRLAAEGAVIIREGEVAQSVFFLISGEFAIYINRGAGQLLRVGTIHHREAKTYVGDLSVFGEAKASATVVASARSVCLVLHRSNADAFADLMPEMKTHAVVMAQQVHEMNQQQRLGMSDAAAIKQLVDESGSKVNRLLGIQQAVEATRHKGGRKQKGMLAESHRHVELDSSKLRRTFQPPPHRRSAHDSRGSAEGKRRSTSSMRSSS